MPVTRTMFLVTISKAYWYMLLLTTKHEYGQLQNDIKVVRTLNLFVHKNLFIISLSLLSMPILFMGINRGYLPATFWVCFVFFLQKTCCIMVCKNFTLWAPLIKRYLYGRLDILKRYKARNSK